MASPACSLQRCCCQHSHPRHTANLRNRFTRFGIACGLMMAQLLLPAFSLISTPPRAVVHTELHTADLRNAAV